MILKIKEKVIAIIYLIKFRLLNKNKNFTIISSNCIGGAIYQDLKIKYNSPTVGLFFYAPCYIKFIYNLQYYLSLPLTFQKTSKYFDDNITYPIGRLDDIEIHFQHYENDEEAYEKWNKRIKRINYTNIFYTFSDRDMCTQKELNKFEEFGSENKICFTSKRYPKYKSLVWIKEYIDQETVDDLYSNKLYRKYLGLINWFNYTTKKIS